MTAPRLVVVSGLPASGKSTVARTLAGALGLPLLDKDVFLEALFASDGIGDAAWRRSLSQRADAAFARQAASAVATGGAVLASWWRHRLSPVASGTSTGWLAPWHGSIVEVHCRCPAAVAVQCFMSRHRHAGHLDGRWSQAELLASFEVQAALGALGVGPVVTAETDALLPGDSVAASVGAYFVALQETA